MAWAGAWLTRAKRLLALAALGGDLIASSAARRCVCSPAVYPLPNGLWEASS